MQISRMKVSTRVATLAAALSCAFLAVVPATLSGQQPAAPAVTQQGGPVAADTAAADATAPTLRRHPIFTSRDFVVGATLATTAAALIAADGQIAREFQRPGPQSSSALRGAADGVEMIASPGAIVFGGSLYVVGLIARKRTVADLGWHTLEALAVSGQVTSVLKGLFGRSRPYASGGDAGDFDFGGGFGSATRRSFPSGHTSMAFAFASVVAEETSHRWPRAHRVIAPIAYASATGVGLARMYNDKHWASDVALGAAIGTLSGRLVVRYAHGRPGNLIDRIALRPVKGR
ncbi:MAG: phosphatase PAP2 family protein [Gemmatimonadota bacterium]|nr:phosphatase PAP2 family protein [Gemmatimonadota bacterium]